MGSKIPRAPGSQRRGSRRAPGRATTTRSPVTELVRMGGCLCGGVHFEIQGSLRPVLACHCSQCRKTSGHFWAATEVHQDQIDIRDTGTLRWYRSSDFAQRGFCNRCGASLFWRRVGGEEFLSIGAGCIDVPTGLVTQALIFVGDASDYYQILPSETQWVRSPQNLDADLK